MDKATEQAVHNETIRIIREREKAGTYPSDEARRAVDNMLDAKLRTDRR